MAQLHFYQEPTPLDKNKHAKLKLDRSGDFSYAANVNAVPVAGVEFFKCSRHFPVVFVKNSEKGYIPLALLSLRKDSHAARERKGYECFNIADTVSVVG